MVLSGLYVITDSGLGARLFAAAEDALRAGAQTLQYRQKGLQYHLRLRQANVLRELCRHYNARFIVNDDACLARVVGADGVHLGEHDLPLAEVRQLLGPQVLLGVSCYNQFSRAVQAQQQGADYIAIGRFFSSKSKPEARLASIDLLARLRGPISIPIVAIGGITARNAGALLHAGADAVAVIADVFGATDVYAASAAYGYLFDA